MENLFQTKGIDLLKVVEDAKANGNVEFAELVERAIKNVQSCYDCIAQRYTSCGPEDLWKIDAEYLKSMLV